MNRLTQKDLQAGKDALDKLIKHTKRLARTTEIAMVTACRSDELDLRDELAHVAGDLHIALGHLHHARSHGGALKGQNITRAGGT